MNCIDAYRMVRRRTAEAGFKVKPGCHVFRATGITAYLEAGGTGARYSREKRNMVFPLSRRYFGRADRNRCHRS
jgi:hypothetical protein